MWYFTYILQNNKNDQYVGHAQNLKARLRQHNAGEVSSTTNGRPWQIACFSGFRTKKEAITFEKYLKSGSGSMFRLRHLVSKR